MKNIAIALILVSCSLGLKASACDPHWVTAIFDEGEIIQLENNTLWKTFDLCLPEAGTWEAGDNVEVCDDKKMRNTDKDPVFQEWIQVKQLSPVNRTKESECDPRQ